MSRLSLDSWFAGVVTLRHALAFTGQLRHRVIVNGEAVMTVSRDLGLRYRQTCGVVQLIRQCGKLSPERLAVIAMRDPGYDDADIAEIFGRSVRWARLVREQADEIRSAEPVPERLEWVDPDLQPDDPMPHEIRDRAMAIREAKRDQEGLVAPNKTMGNLRHFKWSNKTSAFLPSSA
jgi:hypothetical protein